MFNLQHNEGWQHRWSTPEQLCQQLSSLLEDTATSEQEIRKTVEVLAAITAWLNTHKPDDKTIVCVGGHDGGVLRCLAVYPPREWSVTTAALQCVYSLCQHFPHAPAPEPSLSGAAPLPPQQKRGGGGVAAVVVELQQLMTRLLQTPSLTPRWSHGEASCWVLRITQNLLLCSPHTILPTTLITACRPYMFYGLPAAYRSALQHGVNASTPAADWEEQVDAVLSSSDHDQASAAAKYTYNNRNRRKRLRRKKTQPAKAPIATESSSRSFSCASSASSSKLGSWLPSSSTPSGGGTTGRFSSFRSTYATTSTRGRLGGYEECRGRFSSFTSSAPSSTMPSQLKPPDPASLNALSLKPQWARGFSAKSRNAAETASNTLHNNTNDLLKFNNCSSNDIALGDAHTFNANNSNSKDTQLSDTNSTYNIANTCTKTTCSTNNATINADISKENSLFRNTDYTPIVASGGRKDMPLGSNTKTNPVQSADSSCGQHSMSKMLDSKCALIDNIGKDKKMLMEDSETSLNKMLREDKHVESINDNLDDVEISEKQRQEKEKKSVDQKKHECPEGNTEDCDDQEAEKCGKMTSAQESLEQEDDHSQTAHARTHVGYSDGGRTAEQRAALTAQVRLCALAAVNALIAVCSPRNRLSLWVPLLSQSPSLLTGLLLVEPRSSVRGSAMAVLAALLADARQPLAAATDRADRSAYGSLCYQLGTSLREMHRVLAQVLVRERSVDGAVRGLKLVELLLTTTTYARLCPGLITSLFRAVRPFITHHEAVVVASALSVMVSLLVVKPPVAEVTELLLRYSAPRPAGRSAAAATRPPVHASNISCRVSNATSNASNTTAGALNTTSSASNTIPCASTTSALASTACASACVSSTTTSWTGTSICKASATCSNLPVVDNSDDHFLTCSDWSSVPESSEGEEWEEWRDEEGVERSEEENEEGGRTNNELEERFGDIRVSSASPDKSPAVSVGGATAAMVGGGRRTVVGWLVGRCVDALMSPHSHTQMKGGIYEQVELQALKVLGALVSEHFLLVFSRLGVITRVISAACQPFHAGGLADTAVLHTNYESVTLRAKDGASPAQTTTSSSDAVTETAVAGTVPTGTATSDATPVGTATSDSTPTRTATPDEGETRTGISWSHVTTNVSAAVKQEQKAIAIVSTAESVGLQDNFYARGGTATPSADSGVVVEHVYPLLGALLGALKHQCEKQDASSGSACGDNLGSSTGGGGDSNCGGGRSYVTNTVDVDAYGIHVSTQFLRRGSAAVSDAEAEMRMKEKAVKEAVGIVDPANVDWHKLSLRIWLWALQDPLRPLLLLPAADALIGRTPPTTTATATTVGLPPPSVVAWARGLRVAGEAGELLRRQVVAAADVLTGLTTQVVEGLGEQQAAAIFSTVLWLIRHPQGEVSVWGLRVAGALCGLAAMQRAPQGVQVIRAAVAVATCTLMPSPTAATDRVKESVLLSDNTKSLSLADTDRPLTVSDTGYSLTLPDTGKQPILTTGNGKPLILSDTDNPLTVIDTGKPLSENDSEGQFAPLTQRQQNQQHQQQQRRQQQQQHAVNKHRLVAVSALANVAAVLGQYSSFSGGKAGVGLLSQVQVERLLEAALLACHDKSNIRPHGVRCLGSVVGWLRESADHAAQGNTSASHRAVAAVWDSLNISPTSSTTSSPTSSSPAAVCVVQRSLAVLSRCCSEGSNMKMRWNACHALQRILSCPLPVCGGQEWRGPILSLLCSLVGGFHNYKVRLHACAALCAQPHRALYGPYTAPAAAYYEDAWHALLDAANSAQNVADYLEMRHRDDLVCQVVQGLWRLSCLVLASDCRWLYGLLLEHEDSIHSLMRRAQDCLPPHGWTVPAMASKHVGDLLGADVLTDEEAAGLTMLQGLLLTEPPLANTDLDVTAP